MILNNGKIHFKWTKWPFSIAMFVYQRGSKSLNLTLARNMSCTDYVLPWFLHTKKDLSHRESIAEKKLGEITSSNEVLPGAEMLVEGPPVTQRLMVGHLLVVSARFRSVQLL